MLIAMAIVGFVWFASVGWFASGGWVLIAKMKSFVAIWGGRTNVGIVIGSNGVL